MKKQFKLIALALMAGFALVGCNDKDKTPSVSGIPSDDNATANPVVSSEDLNTVLPNVSYSVSTENGWKVVRLDMTGVQDPFTKDWMKLYGPTNASTQNAWIELDGVPKGFSLTNTIDELATLPDPAVDLVFLVDNSTSMSEEADAICRDIIEWAEQLSSTLDIRFACVGYGGFISGAINLTTAPQLKDYLENKSWMSSNVNGVWRTRGFAGSDAATLEAAANDENYRVVSNYYSYTNWSDPDYNECGVMALRFANDLFSFRRGANRVYVNITDEPNQPADKPQLFSTQWVKDNWTSTMGTIHTVYTRSAAWANDYSEYIGENYPWDLSVYTDGTMLFTNSNFRDINGNTVKLSDLPVSGALENSYIIRFTNVENLFDGKSHKVHMTVKSQGSKGDIIADKTYDIVFEKD